MREKGIRERRKEERERERRRERRRQEGERDDRTELLSLPCHSKGEGGSAGAGVKRGVIDLNLCESVSYK